MADVFRSGSIVVDATQRRVRVAGRAVILGARALDVLLALIERRDRVVSKDELLDAAWPGLVVEEANVQVQVSALRAAIGRDAIATVPGFGYRLTLAADVEVPAAAPPGGDAPAAQPRSLPEADDDLLGRTADCTALAAALAAHRLVTIAGPAGIGKTRVALAVCHRVREAFADGVCWVDLAALTAADHIAGAVATAAGVTLGPGEAQAELQRALRRRVLLLVLDNCEHLAAAVARLVRDSLAAAPGLRVLATSQVPLNLGAEQCYRIEPLALPAVDAQPETARRTPALALLLRRARAIDRRFTVDDATLATASAICRQLDGMPLAIELAGARLPLLGVRALHDMLDQRLTLLRHPRSDMPPRQQALQAALDWSCALLSPQELQALHSLSSFAASFRLDSAVAVLAAATPADAIDTLSSLVDKSLVQVEQREPPRYRLLDSTRLHAAHGLAQSDAAAAAAQLRWRLAMAVLARESEHAFWAMPDAAWIARYQADQPDLMLAFDACSQARDVESAGAIGQTLQRLDELRSVGSSKRHLKQAALLLVSTPGLADGRCAELWNLLASFPEIQVDGYSRTAAAERRLACWRERGDAWQLYRALGALAMRRAGVGAVDDALGLLAEARALARTGWPPRLRATLAAQAAVVHKYAGDVLAHKQQASAFLSLATQAGSPLYVFRARILLAEALSTTGELTQSIPMLQAMADECRALGQPGNEVIALATLCTAQLLSEQVEGARTTAARAWPVALEHQMGSVFFTLGAPLAALQGRHGVAARLLGYQRRPSLTADQSESTIEGRLLSMAQARLEAALGAEPLTALCRQGEQLDEEAAMALLADVLSASAVNHQDRAPARLPVAFAGAAARDGCRNPSHTTAPTTTATPTS